ncbi:MFS transporter [Roseateles sp.]|uniref:MFS transporter n=1 Tax=Roseateles sp. TaxID=1971397 RepID=UPI003BA84CF0
MTTTPAVSSPAMASPPLPGRLPARYGFLLLASIVMSLLAASTAPSPLYGLYREAWGFSALMLTFVFAIYAFALLGGLLVFGALSDHIGRRPVLLVALALELGSLVLFWWADSVGWLVAARLLQGLATGIATATLSAALLDLQRERGALVNSVAPMLGMAVGALGASALVQFVPQPAHRVFEALGVLLLLQTLAACCLAETVPRRAGAWASLRPRLSIPKPALSTLLLILPMNTAQWALGGFYTSLGPTLARHVSGLNLPLIGGGLIATLVLSGAVGILWLRNRPARRVLAGSSAMLITGLAVTLWGIHAHAVLTLFAGSAIAGTGFGAGFNASVRSLVPLAPAEQRGAMMASFFVLSYLAFSVPALAAGLAVGLFGLEATALGYGAVLIVLCGWAGLKLVAREA